MTDRRTYEDFEKKYLPIYNPDPENGDHYLWETYGEEWERIKATNENHVWTMVDGEYATMLIAGRHRTDRIAYVICEKPWADKDEEYYF